MILVSPTDRALHNVLPYFAPEKWKIDALPEQHGCDVLVIAKGMVVGFQRKTLPDLVASLHDGRLAYELNQLSVSATVRYGFLLVEATFNRTTDGSYYTEANLSVGALRSIVAKFSVFGIGFVPTSTPRDTVDACLSVSRYVSGGKASAIHRPKAVSNEWGQVTNRAYGIFLLQSFPGIGPTVAAAIYDHFGTVPLAWTIDAADLAKVPGVGRKRAETLLASLRRPAGPATP